MKLLIVSAWLAVAAADVSHVLAAQRSQAQRSQAQPQKGPDADAPILRQELDVSPDGAYQWAYETGNGISAQEQGQQKPIDPETSANTVQGQAQWQTPDGETVQLQYVADENGYQPQGSHLPTPPPIPEAILRALEYIRSHPPAEDPQQ